MLSFPPNCNTPTERTEYAYRAQELLRLRHNKEGAKFQPYIAELKQRESDEISAEPDLEGKQLIGLKYKTQVETHLVPFRQWVKDWFDPKQEQTTSAILEARALLKRSKKWEIDVEAL